MPFRREVAIDAVYKGDKVGEGQLDFLIAERLVVEIKAVDRLLPLHSAQLIFYLKATGLPLGLLLDFHTLSLRKGIVRIAN